MKKIWLLPAIVFFTIALSLPNAVLGQIANIIIVPDAGKKGEYVLVTPGNKESEVPDKVVMEDFKASDEAFDPYKTDSFPRWKIHNVLVDLSEDQTVRYIALQCLANKKYLKKHPENNGAIMVSEEEYDKLWEKDETGEYKVSFEEKIEYLFRPRLDVEEGNIVLGYDTREEGCQSRNCLSPEGWECRGINLIFVKK